MVVCIRRAWESTDDGNDMMRPTNLLRTFGTLAVVLTICGGVRGASTPLADRIQLTHEVAGEILARNLREILTRKGMDAAPPSRYDAALVISDFLENLDNLNALGGRPGIEPIRSNPSLYFERASRKAIEELKFH